MIRRKFISTAGLGILGTTIPFDFKLYAVKSRKAKDGYILTAKEINDHLRSLATISESSVDRIVIGNPLTPVKKIGTAWMPYWKTCKKAVEDGVNVLVTHEPLFYGFYEKENESPGAGNEQYEDIIIKKKQWITDSDLVIIRCHDVWDKIPEIGIPFGLGKALGYSDDDLIRSTTFYNVYRTEQAPAIEVAARVAEALKIAGQPGIGFYGDENYPVKSVGVGTGCFSDPVWYSWLEPDLFIAIDNIIKDWVQPLYAEDTGKPLVVINHGTSEEFGIRLLNQYLKKKYPEYEIIHYDQGCSYRWMKG